MKLSFHGADRGVTGSCHLVECNGRRILIDCGLYQGCREMEEENAEPFGFEPLYGVRDKLRAWRNATGNPGRTLLVHGDEEAMQAFAGRLRGTEVVLPRSHQEIAL